jgi:hypothetical protein
MVQPGQNTLSPGFIKMYYISGAGQHSATIPVLPFLAVGNVWRLQGRGGVQPTWKDWLDGYVAVCRPMTANTVSYQYAELWHAPDTDLDPVYADTHEIELNGSGTNQAGSTPSGQIVFTGRTTNGGLARAYLMGPVYAPNQLLRPPLFGGATPVVNWVNYITANNTCWVGRDDGYAFAAIKVLTKTNDALRRRRNRLGLG